MHASELAKARLEEQLASARSSRNLRNLTIAIGSGSIGFAIDLWSNGFQVQAVVLSIVGAILVLFSWFSTPKGRQIVEPITELSLVTVLQRGVANKECIALKAKAEVDLGQYGLMVGYRQPSGLTIPLKDQLLWFDHYSG